MLSAHSVILDPDILGYSYPTLDPQGTTTVEGTQGTVQYCSNEVPFSLHVQHTVECTVVIIVIITIIPGSGQGYLHYSSHLVVAEPH